MTEIETWMLLPAHKRTATLSVKGQIDKKIIKDYNHLPGNLDATATMSLYIPPQKTAPFFDAIFNEISWISYGFSFRVNIYLIDIITEFNKMRWSGI